MRKAKNPLSGWLVILALVVTNGLYLTMVLWSIPMVEDHIQGRLIPDMMQTGYSYEYLNKLLNDLGENGRADYLTVQLPLDMIYPLLFGFTYSLVIIWLLLRVKLFESRWIFLVALPVIVSLSDYMENISIIMMLNTLNDLKPWLVTTGSVLTVIKSGSSLITFFTILVLFVIFLSRKVKGRLVNRTLY